MIMYLDMYTACSLCVAALNALYDISYLASTDTRRASARCLKTCIYHNMTHRYVTLPDGVHSQCLMHVSHSGPPLPFDRPARDCMLAQHTPASRRRSRSTSRRCQGRPRSLRPRRRLPRGHLAPVSLCQGAAPGRRVLVWFGSDLQSRQAHAGQADTGRFGAGRWLGGCRLAPCADAAQRQPANSEITFANGKSHMFLRKCGRANVD